MKNLIPGKYGLCIAHPGHELRLHGFLEQAKPFVWILTDGSHRTGQDIMFDSIKCIDKATKHGLKITLADAKDDSLQKALMYTFPANPPENMHLKDIQIYEAILTNHTEFFLSYIDFIAARAIKYDLDFLVSDAREGRNVCHEVMAMMTDLAVKLIRKATGKHVGRYELPLYELFNSNMPEDAIKIDLDDEAVKRKIQALLEYPLALTDLNPNISVDYNVIIELRKMKEGGAMIESMLHDLNAPFLRHEYLRPYSFIGYTEKPKFEVAGEKAVQEGKYYNAITWKNHLEPLHDTLLKMITGNAN